MSQAKKIWLGILAFLPIVLTIGFIIYAFSSFIPEMIRMDKMEQDEEQAVYFFSRFLPFLITAILSSLAIIGLKIYFIFHAINNAQVKTEERIVWLLLFLFLSAVAFPIYWIIRIMQEPRPESNFVKQ